VRAATTESAAISVVSSAVRFVNFQPLGFEADVLEIDTGRVVAVTQTAAEIVEVDLNGAIVVPAFRDGHAHPLFAGREALGVRVSECGTIDEVTRQLAKYADQSDAEWIIGGAYDRSLHPSPRAEWLDAVVTDRPVVLHASDHHTIWANTEALRRAGLLDHIPNLTNGSVDVDSAGQPTGVLREPGAMALILDLIPKPTLETELAALDWAQNYMLALGIVEVQDAWVTKAEAETYLAAARAGRLKLTFNLAFRIEADSWRENIEFFEGVRAEIRALANPMMRVNAAKFFADGVFGSGTAMVSEPYLDRPHHGEPVWQREELFEATRFYSENGYQLHIHAIGDAAIALALDAIEQSGAPMNDLPSVIAHAELIADADLSRFEALNVVANMQPLWAKEDGMLLSCEPGLGRGRIDKMYRMRDLLSQGGALAFGSDWPVSSVDPLLGIATAVTRAAPDGQPWTPEQAVTLGEAVAAYTSGVCHQLGHPTPLTVGSVADFLTLNGSLEKPFSLTVEGRFVRGAKQ
jgi:predicted amidohydrolase YtcJ